MKKLLGAVIVFLFSFVVFGGSNQVYALDSCSEVFGRSISISNFVPDYGPIFIAGQDGSVNASITGLTPSETYTVTCEKNGFAWGWPDFGSYPVTANATGTGNLVIPTGSCWSEEGEYRLKLTTSTGVECEAHSYEVLDQGDAAYCVSKSVTDSEGRNGCFEAGETIYFEFEIANGDGTPYTELVGITSNTYNGTLGFPENQLTPNSDGRVSGSKVVANPGSTMLFRVYAEADISKQITSCTVTGPQVAVDSCTEEERENGTGPTNEGPDSFSLCEQIPAEQTEAREACYACTGGEGENEANDGVWTAIGCIKRDPVSIMQRLITLGLGISGGVALITFLAAGFIFSTSQGDPKATGQAKEMMTASIVGILFVIFSVTILQFIGFSILKIPGFGG